MIARIVFLSVLTAAPVLAQENAIGRLNYAGLRDRAHCTAFLTGPKTVMTARHCVDRWPKGDLRLVLGYDRGNWVELHRIKSIHKHPSQDVATLCLNKRSRIKPMAVDRTLNGRKVLPVDTSGYPRSRPHRQVTLSCYLQPAKRSARMECPVEPGMSGSPVIATTVKGSQVIGIASGTSSAFSIIERIRDGDGGVCG
ncbi:MAG: serine protease [Pseudomonadota bacterium]